MSETLHQSPEKTVEAPEVTVEKPAAAEYGEREKTAKIEQAQSAVKAAESAATEKPQSPQLPATDDRPLFIDNAIKSLRLRQNLAKVQNRLKPGERTFSKVVHQPLVRMVSDSAANTVSRPSGLLGGGITAFLGSLLYLYLAHHIGFRYNYTLFLAFFVGGFIVGVLIELLIHRSRPKAN